MTVYKKVPMNRFLIELKRALAFTRLDVFRAVEGSEILASDTVEFLIIFLQILSPQQPGYPRLTFW